MGEPIKIVELARNLITLAGLDPDTDIEIKFTGMRPGEKIFEVSPTEGAGVKPTHFPSIFQIPSDTIDANKLQPQLNQLSEWLTSSHSTPECLQILTQIIQSSVSQ
jgi:FlaA1/EpsC-like NDP-sugar epimerase